MTRYSLEIFLNRWRLRYQRWYVYHRAALEKLKGVLMVVGLIAVLLAGVIWFCYSILTS